MQFISFQTPEREIHAGLKIPGTTQVLDLATSGHFKSILDVVSGGEKSLAQCSKLVETYSGSNAKTAHLLNEAELIVVAPIPEPVSMRDGYAFRQHVESARKGRGLPMIPEFDHFPVFYFTNHLAVTGPGEIFVMPKALERLDFELEVAIVLGREGRNIPAKDADSYIFGYTIMNDWSARELQAQEMKLNLGPAKGKDFATSLGPVLVTRDELEPHRVSSDLGDRLNLEMKAFHNGKQVSQGNLRDMTWTFAQILERVSYGVTVHPGEVIGSGTVGTGCYMELNATHGTNHWIQAGDTFALEVAGLGRLENTIRAALL
jgi:fumarylacetoacetate (FAA) hydrolase